jgi:hypothetical protein
VSDPTPQELTEAIAAEEKIAQEAAELRDGATELTPALLLTLEPLLRKPIPAGFIKEVGEIKGKPYDSKGVSSVQVQIDRMNNVLTSMWWWDEVEYDEGGKVAKVTIYIGDRAAGTILVERSSRGGVDRGSTLGNVYKGSYTNAAKPAFARVGPGHEVYLGAADFDPDVNAQLAEQGAKAETAVAIAEDAEIGPGIAGKMVDRAFAIPAAQKSLQLAASHASGKDVGDCSTREAAIEGLAGLTFAQAEKLDRWLSKKESGGEGGDDE